ncbi:MAG: ATP-binding protein [Fibrobacterales bacterium]
MNDWKVQKKINAIIIVVFIVCTVLFTGIHVVYQQKRVEAFTEKISLLLNTLVERDRKALANEIFESRLRAIKIRVEQMNQVQGMLAITVYNTVGEVLYRSSAGELASEKLDNQFTNRLMQHSLSVIEDYNDQRSLAYYQRISVVGETLGYIKMNYSMRDVELDENIAFGLLALQLIILFVVLFFLIKVFISRSIVFPLKELEKTMSNLEFAKPGKKVVVRGNDEIGKLSKAFNTMSDELLEAQGYIDNIINSMPSILIGLNAECMVTLWNSKVERHSGINSKEAYGKNIVEVFPELGPMLPMIIESIESGVVHQKLRQEHAVEAAIRYEDITVYPLITEAVVGAVIRIDDVTEKVQMDAMIVQSEKMLSVGGLAAGMAHEINNPLAGMIQSSNVLINRIYKNLEAPVNKQVADSLNLDLSALKTYMEQRKIPQMVENINSSGIRVSKIVENMLSFSRMSDSEKTTAKAGDIIDTTIELAETDFNLKKKFDFRAIEIVKDYGDNVPDVECEIAKIQQVLLNIFRNGAQAMQEAHIEKPCFTVRTYLDDTANQVCLEIEDNGPGMSEEVRKRIFEPFFTTKSVGSGTGLGLSVSFFIITEHHGGEMFVKSQLGEGATFIIKLPL